MIDLGNGRYQIRNTDTGETRVVGEGELQNYGLQPPNQDPLPGFIKQGLPIAGTILGAGAGGGLGALGGALVPGADLTGIPEVAGAYAGGVGGAAIGSAGGQGLVTLLEQALHGPAPKTLGDYLGQVGQAGAQGGIAEAIGAPIAKGLGVLAHPIQPWIDMVNSKLAASPAMINIGNILSRYRNEVLPQFTKETMGQDATAAYNRLEPDIVNSAKSYLPAGQGGIDNELVNKILTGQTTNIPASEYQNVVNNPLFSTGQSSEVSANIKPSQELSIPVSNANQMKRNISSSVSKAYGTPTANQDVLARKAMANLFKQEVSKAVRSTDFPNKVASTLYKFPDFLSSILSKIPIVGSAASHVNPAAAMGGVLGAPFGPVGAGIGAGAGYLFNKTVPSGGGWLNQLLPALFQANQQSQSSQPQQ